MIAFTKNCVTLGKKNLRNFWKYFENERWGDPKIRDQNRKSSHFPFPYI